MSSSSVTVVGVAVGVTIPILAIIIAAIIIVVTFKLFWSRNQG